MPIISVTSAAPLSNTTIGSGVSAVVYSGGIADDITVTSGGVVIVSAGGSAVSTTVDSGANISVTSGGTTTGTFVGTLGTEWVSPGGSTTATVLSGGLGQDAGASYGTIVLSGGDQQIYEFANSGTIISSGGGAVVNDGDFITSAEVYSGGLLAIEANGLGANLTTVFNGGTLLIDHYSTANYTSLGLGAILDLPGLAFYSGATTSLSPTDLLTVITVSSYLLEVSSSTQLIGNYNGDSFSVSSNTYGVTQVVVMCLVAGTMILTDHGEVPVEHLGVGDLVVTAHDARRPIRWIGRRHVDCGKHPRPATVWPVRIAAGTFDQGQPSRPLWLSPDHCLLVDGHLIPARELLNGTTIRQVQVPSVDYFHIELDSHDVILAEGLPVESYLDAGQRGAFEGAVGAMQLHPSFAAAAWETACAPLAVGGEVVERVKRRLVA